MFFLKIIRTYVDLNKGAKRREVVLFTRNSSPIVVSKMLSLYKSNNMLEGDDEVILQSNGRTLKHYRICLICQDRAQDKPKAICKLCAAKAAKRNKDLPRHPPMANLDVPLATPAWLAANLPSYKNLHHPPQILKPDIPSKNLKHYKFGDYDYDLDSQGLRALRL